ncbi:MAG: NAD-dependent epimerase/dehydratase family protein [Anaerolineae bacterium]
MRVLVTGATGFIGGHLARYLASDGHYVRALVRPGNESRVSALAEADVELAWGDITDPEAVRLAVDGMDAVFHLAAVRDVWGTPESVYQRVNVEGTRLMLDAAVDGEVQRFVYCSSVGVARYPGNLKADEALPFCEPTSQILYHRSKAHAEQVVLEWARADRVPALVVRPVITYGPGDEWGMVTRLVMLLAQGWFVPVGNGRNHVDLVYIDDLVTGMYHAWERGDVGRVYILSGIAPIQMQTLIGKICGLLGKRPPHIYIPALIARVAGWGMETLDRIGNRLGIAWEGKEPIITRDKVATLTVDRGFSHKRARRELEYRPRVDYDEGLQRTLDWLQETRFFLKNLVSWPR